MRLRHCVLWLGLVAGTAPPMHAQQTWHSTGAEFGNAVADIFHIWTAPFHSSGRDWLGTGAAVVVFGALMPFDDQIDRWIVTHQNSGFLDVTQPFRRSNSLLAPLSTDSRLLPIFSTLLVTGMVSNSRPLREAGYGCISAWAASSTVRGALYAGVGRTRPIAAHGDQFDFTVPGGDWNHHSFFGGHTTNAFACASFLSQRFHLSVGEPLLYTVAATIGVARMADRNHWASDTFLGSAVGVAIGRSIAARYDRRAERRDSAATRSAWYDGVHLAPTPNGLAIAWQRAF
jgi:membrane-associated phospholipid phosphatase